MAIPSEFMILSDSCEEEGTWAWAPQDSSGPTEILGWAAGYDQSPLSESFPLLLLQRDLSWLDALFGHLFQLSGERKLN